jgi:N-acetylmuramoyl-L-alanine amidase
MSVIKKILFLWLSVLIILIMVPASHADSAKGKYYAAEACYKNLRNDDQKKKYRDSWLKCIKKFRDAYQHDTRGPWAAASLYRTGTLYYELYKISYKGSDKWTAVDLFTKIVEQYPKSRYHPEAKNSIREITGKPYAKKIRVSRNDEDDARAKKKYIDAQNFYRKLQKDPNRQKYRHHWQKGIKKFMSVYDTDKNGPWAAAGLYRSATLYHEMYQRSYLDADLKEALKLFRRVISNYPQSRYREKSAVAIKKISRPDAHKDVASIIRETEAIRDKTEKPPREIPVAKPHGRIEEKTLASTEQTTVTGLRFWSNPSYTRVVVDADRETPFIHHLLKKDPSLNKPQRLFIDLRNSRLGKDLKRKIPIDDDLLLDARAGQYNVDTVRVVVDIKSFKTYKIFSLNNPFRIVLDMWGKEARAVKKDPPPIKLTQKDKKVAGSTLTKQLALGVNRIVIDAGHGGRDFGAPGYFKGVHEKEVVLKLATRLAKMIRKNLKCETILTRTGDQFLTLEERTAFANTKNADLFISLHTNAHKDRRAYGIETYFLNLATDEESIRVAAMENATTKKNISDLETILNDLMQHSKINESSRLAYYVQNSVCRHLIKKGYGHIRNKGVKQAPFYVLLGAQMPSILIETSFISNKRECRRLTSDKYQQRFCEGIVAGIRKYIKETSPAAYQRKYPSNQMGG